ncbi:MAG: polysaccharide deacetylase family protein [Endomicrobia bacterium]|nr:polysaccharide deacetylase family protein [Endomicrobiia bacterium]
MKFLKFLFILLFFQQFFFTISFLQEVIYLSTNVEQQNNELKTFLSVDDFIHSKEYKRLKTKIVKKFCKFKPTLWGTNLPGVKTKLNTTDRVIALTFDACGNPGSFGYDEELINFLIQENIPATLFLNGKWIDVNPHIAKQLSTNPLFEIGNHGLEHKPCSVNSNTAYGIQGTKNIEELIDEVELNSEKLKKLTGKKPRYFRSGTAHYDDVSVKIITYLGYEIVNFTVNGDYGATAKKEVVKRNIVNAPNGAIILLHMNHPQRETAEGVMLAVSELKHTNIRFVKLSDYPLK